jgi:hypothetical protein
MRESQQVLEWQAEARVEGQQDLLRRVLEQRFQTPVPADLSAVIETLTDPDDFVRWITAAYTASNLDAYRAVVLHKRNGS